MTRLRLRSAKNFDYPDDVERIVRVFAERGYEISPTEAQEAWKGYSDCLAAGWLILPENDEDVFLAAFGEFDTESGVVDDDDEDLEDMTEDEEALLRDLLCDGSCGGHPGCRCPR